MLHDDTTTVSQLKEAIYALCLEKGWGVDGVQNPQQVAMAMTVEMSELLELFQWLNPPDVEKLLNSEDPAYVARIAEEFADVMMYGMQLMRALKIDVSAEIEHKIEVVRGRPANRKNLHPFQ